MLNVLAYGPLPPTLLYPDMLDPWVLRDFVVTTLVPALGSIVAVGVGAYFSFWVIRCGLRWVSSLL